MKINDKIIFEKNKEIVIYYSNDLARKNNQFTLEEEKALHLIFSHIKPFEKKFN